MRRPGEATLRRLLEPIAGPLTDDGVTDIVVNRPGEVGIERRGRWHWRPVPAFDAERLEAIATLCAALTQQDVGPERPLCASVLPDGQRVQICRPPAVAAGTLSLTIRRPSAFAPTIPDLAAGGLFAGTERAGEQAAGVDAELLALHRRGDWQRFFPLAVRAKKTLIASGDTGSGKTTFAKALIAAIPLAERLVTIEDTPEFIALPQRNRVALFYSKGGQGAARVDAEDLIEAALRMRPDRVLMQELRDGAAFTFLRAIAAGHPGAVTTCHAASALEAFDALRLMVKQHEAGRHLADADIQALLRQRVDIVAHCRRGSGGFGIAEVYFDPPAGRAAGAPCGERGR
ncbi:P-type DNA transfer ATPase VirB11 [Azospirillum picis]|uniref:Type IV secretion system protein n=1 Tax=Azospirillum picis TaxID=488438 RepID=A0ABU0MU72_9PROT|nr:P-type DNA transfer ATPase VirB11 [Azospirillum picis]MBP2300918.1 type IV secretion system protein VirB11 [Azospirillum picis]MDQ0537022.1 type IV secretion system protein VirB11 [Azospirillum picis]